MGKRTRGKEQKGKKTKIRMKSCIYIFCEGKTEKIYLQHYENSTYNVQVIPVNTGHTDAVGIVRYAKKYISDHLEEAVKRAERLELKQRQIYRVHSHECNPYTDMFKFVAYMDELKTENEKILKKEDASMQTMLEYKGYHAKIEYDADDKIYVGKVIGITDIVCFHGESMEEAKRMFEQSIENYEERSWKKR